MDTVPARLKATGWYRHVVSRPRGPLPPERAASRLSAYVYGNILALGPVAFATARTIDDGAAAALVVGTGATTFLAHIFAHFVAHATVAGHEPSRADQRQHAAEELRDAVPIASSAFAPAVLLMLGWLGVLSTQWA
jgi:hypothetical protein